MSTTPRTDEQTWIGECDEMNYSPRPVVNATFARELETELVAEKMKSQKIARWILTERAKYIVGKSRSDIQEEQTSPLPVTLWVFARELVGHELARQLAQTAIEAQREKLK